MTKSRLSLRLVSTRKSTAIHETHAQYSKMPKYGPTELTRMKAEKDARDSQDQALRRRTEEIRQQQIRDMARGQLPASAVVSFATPVVIQTH